MNISRKPAKIALEDGRVFSGWSFGAETEKCGEVVFNTSMTGYQEILTDPSYRGQIVVMTYPLIGNYGVNDEDVESRGIFVEGLVVKEASRTASNWRSKRTLQEYLKESGIPGIEGVDTRALTRHIRLKGAMKAVISAVDLDDKSLAEKAKRSPGLEGRDLVKEVTSKEALWWTEHGKYKVVVIDCGVKYNILRELARNGCKVLVLPASATAERILAERPDGVMISNGPGDPAAVTGVIQTTKALLGKVPIFGICLGNQMLGLALGGKTYKLKFGHHGGNHPVKDTRTGKVDITVQNHGFCVDIDTLDKDDVEVTHINLNDNTLEGMMHRKLNFFSVQFHPENCPGPRDSEYLFGRFTALMEECRAKKG
ncbi:MAG: glutamine-hydrolyzing carbamoyl-phosphate synthase small subunit [Candidatus Omnitrophica bacterium]|nr:glutamine-hydrolyzing carbamoyl-phosphate synthase small subunit [Candidatus Omnitrophota bacterium]MDD4013902.1 glutamine-hydrolyzing carbamoyl-phosphate synthase small subunit [Candidatus Omnitrophota bacterium]